MRNSTKVLIGVLLILILILLGYVTYIFIQEKTVIENETEEKNIVNEIEEQNVVNEINTNVAEENTVTNTESNESTETSVELNQNYVGKEEQESNEQSGTENPEQTAIDFAKEKWGETSSSYNFVVENVEGNVYHIAVISNAITIAYMDVDLETGEVTEN